jgi:ubiquinone/menaquinone biosynthesis C-methylase UbiE
MQQLAQLGFPEMYEQALVPALFRPWAEDLVRLVNIGAGDNLLDIACGTGIVARLAKERTGPAGHIVGVDVNPAMLDVARRQAPDIEWRVGDAAALPVSESGAFGVVVCQQGLQFFPDRMAALAEMRRILAPAGRVAVSTWRSDEEMAVLRDLRAIAERHVGSVADRRHSLSDAEELRRMLVDAGFKDVRVAPVTKTVRFQDGTTFVNLNAIALVGMSNRAQGLSNEARSEAVQAIVAESQDLIAANTGAQGFAYEIGANVATALG